MKSVSKIVFISSGLLLTFSLAAVAQDGSVPEPDDEFNLFLFALVAVAICGMFAAAIIGALLTALVLFFLFGGIALGAVSTSVAVGLYQKSFTAGFKTFLKAFYIIASTVISTIGIYLTNGIFHLNLTGATVLTSGIISGIISGLILAAVTYKVLQILLKTLVRKFNLLQ